MEENNNEARKLFDEFQNIWNLEKVKNMTLEEYTNIGNRDDFTYWLEHKLKTLGSIKGNFSHTFGVYRRKSNDDKVNQRGLMYSNKYAWRQKYGNNENKAFEKVKNLILQVIKDSQNNNLEAIDLIDLGDLLKWKIAFHYQNPNDMKIFCIFSDNTLNKIANSELGKTKLKTYEIYPQILENLLKTTPYKFDKVFSMSKNLWNKYNTKENQDNQFATNEVLNQNIGENMTTPPLNQILYGPPGTGKTYSTIDRALEILRHYDKTIEIPKSREDKRKIFDKYRANKQIEFVTFHQSFSYEEFVEGIKPKLMDSSNGAESSKMSYTIKSGIFKEICDRALYKEFQFKSEELEIQANTKTRVWKISIVAKSEKEELRDEVLKHCLEKDEIRIGWGDNKTLEQISMLGRNDQSSIYQFENEADIGDIVCVFENANGDIKGIGIIESEFYWDDTDNSEALKLYPRVRKVKWLSKEQINIRDLNGGIGLTLKTFYPLYRVEAIELLNRIGKLNEKDLIIDNTLKPYILIIDEINRGNISKILGELITLIEPSKRIGGDEELRVTLPYSNDSFGVPSNLYIIGTMNTADRSIALLDTALHRRFEFVEMMPNSSKLQPCGDIDLAQLLNKMNERIEFLLDRERTIGHSFFIEIKSLSDLQKVFKNKIIPLLQEYFYDDYAKIDAVLNRNGMVESKSMSDLGVRLSEDFVDSEKRVYRITHSSAWNATTFTKIYE